jgi:hypothetical protein
MYNRANKLADVRKQIAGLGTWLLPWALMMCAASCGRTDFRLPSPEDDFDQTIPGDGGEDGDDDARYPRPDELPEPTFTLPELTAPKVRDFFPERPCVVVGDPCQGIATCGTATDSCDNEGACDGCSGPTSCAGGGIGNINPAPSLSEAHPGA